MSVVIRLETQGIAERSSFHAAFAELFGFPDFYGANMDAWIDCMSYLREPAAGMSRVQLRADEQVIIEVADTAAFRRRCPELFASLVECAAFVNQRYLDQGERPAIAFAYL